MELPISLIQNPNFLWLNDVIVLVSLGLLVWGIWRITLRYLHALCEKTKAGWDNAFLYAVQSPISFFIGCWTILLSIESLLKHYFSTYDLSWLPTLKFLLVILLFIWAGYRMVNQVEALVLAAAKRDQTTVHAIAKVIRLFVLTIGGLTMMQSLGISLSGLLTFGGVGGLIAGLAAKDLLANFFGGMMLYFDRPFKIGDWVRSPDRDIEGTVEKIGWRMTVIRTFDKRPLYIPNSIFSNIVVENPSRMSHRRIVETIGLRYDDVTKVAPIIEQVKAMLIAHPDIDATQTLIVNFDAFGASSLDFFIYTFTKTTNWVKFHQIKQDVLLKVIGIIHENDADVAFPTQTLHLEQSTVAPLSI